jgi:general secretion pathway protein K
VSSALSQIQTSSRQRGAALILALVVVTIVVVLAASVSSDFLLALRRVENQLQSQQGQAYLRGAETIAREVLQTDFKDANTKDHVSETWLEQEQNFDLEGVGVLRGRLSDLQGRFNLNSLVGGKDPPQGQPFTAEQLLFKRLLENLPMDEPPDPIQAAEITRSVVDWIDLDNNTVPQGGAETPFYSSLEVPMKAGNHGRLYSTSELMWVKGMTGEIYEQLKPLVTAVLPAAAALNVNTASAQVLQAMFDGGTLSEAEQLVLERDGEEDNWNGGYESVDKFNEVFKQLSGNDNSGNGNNNQTVETTVRSDYFLLTADVLFLERIFYMRSVLKREEDGRVKVIARSYTDI